MHKLTVEISEELNDKFKSVTERLGVSRTHCVNELLTSFIEKAEGFPSLMQFFISQKETSNGPRKARRKFG
jgi:metal-responsive CopG/Arc/MetJ family transcriptional regulator